MKLLVTLVLLCGAATAQLPDAPQPQPDGTVCIGPNSCGWKQVTKVPPAPVTFFSFRKSWQDPPLRSNRDMLRSKTYMATQIGGFVAMVAACRNRRSGEEFHSELPAVLGVAGMAYIGGRFFTQSFAVGPGVYEMIHYSLAASR